MMFGILITLIFFVMTVTLIRETLKNSINIKNSKVDVSYIVSLVIQIFILMSLMTFIILFLVNINT